MKTLERMAIRSGRINAPDEPDLKLYQKGYERGFRDARTLILKKKFTNFCNYCLIKDWYDALEFFGEEEEG